MADQQRCGQVVVKAAARVVTSIGFSKIISLPQTSAYCTMYYYLISLNNAFVWQAIFTCSPNYASKTQPLGFWWKPPIGSNTAEIIKREKVKDKPKNIKRTQSTCYLSYRFFLPSEDFRMDVKFSAVPGVKSPGRVANDYPRDEYFCSKSPYWSVHIAMTSLTRSKCLALYLAGPCATTASFW